MLSMHLEAIAVILLIGLLTAKELIRASGTNGLGRYRRVLNIAIAPLLLAYGLIIIKLLVNFLELLD
jgi:hypothetical protein